MRVGGARPLPFTLSTITIKVVVYAPTESADALPLFLLCSYMYSVRIKFFLEPRGDACHTKPSLCIRMGAASHTMAWKLRWPNQTFSIAPTLTEACRDQTVSTASPLKQKAKPNIYSETTWGACRTKPSFSNQEDNHKEKM